jgi:hypothetical protein
MRPLPNSSVLVDIGVAAAVQMGHFLRRQPIGAEVYRLVDEGSASAR